MLNIFKKNTSETNNIASFGLVPNEDGTIMERNLYYADKGGALFNYYVGRDYAFGIEKGDKDHPEGLDADINIAVRYLTYAAEREVREAQELLGLIYFGHFGEEYIDDGKALEWINRSACAGASGSQHLLAVMYRTGTIVEKNADLAFSWTLESATRGSVESMMDLCDYYRNKILEFPEEMSEEEGEEFDDCLWLSYKWGHIAANYGDPRGMFMTGQAYFNGIAVNEDKEEAKKFFEMAAENGYQEAVDFLEENY